jgi:hypothetical protein
MLQSSIVCGGRHMPLFGCRVCQCHHPLHRRRSVLVVCPALLSEMLTSPLFIARDLGF